MFCYRFIIKRVIDILVYYLWKQIYDFYGRNAFNQLNIIYILIGKVKLEKMVCTWHFTISNQLNIILFICLIHKVNINSRLNFCFITILRISDCHMNLFISYWYIMWRFYVNYCTNQTLFCVFFRYFVGKIKIYKCYHKSEVLKFIFSFLKIPINT